VAFPRNVVIPRNDVLIGPGVTTVSEGEAEAEAPSEGVADGAALVGSEDVGPGAPARSRSSLRNTCQSETPTATSTKARRRIGNGTLERAA
jgi:hypothetical protein